MFSKVYSSSVSKTVRQKIDQELGGERKLWAGQPDPRRIFLASLVIWLFGIPWTAFTLFWEAMALGALFGYGKSAPGWGGTIMALWGLPFVAIGLGMMAAPFWLARTAKRTVYVLTDRRLVRFIEARKAITIQTTWPRDVHAIERTERADGSGDLKLSYGSKRDSDGDLVEKSETVTGVGAVRELERLLLQVKAESRA
jgi:hypothetical protein